MNRRVFVLPLLALIFISTKGVCQSWENKDPFYDKAFIENKGQYGTDVFAGTVNSDFSTEFKAGGFNISITHIEKKKKDKEYSNGKEKEIKVYKEKINIGFVNANNTIPLLNLLQQSTFGFQDPQNQNKSLNNIKGYSELRYPNVFNGIDLKFSFDGTRQGIKYQFNVSPGARPENIVFDFSDADALTIDESGRLHIYFAHQELIDDAPKAFVNGQSINIAYAIKGKLVSFILGNYDKTKELIIDPFIANPNFTNQNRAFDIEKDGAGNIYAFGGQSPWKLKKFTAAGVLVWTYNTTYSSWYGDLAVDPAGNSYITEGCCGGGLMKINTNNTIVWNQNYGTQELWCLVFNCDFSTLYLAVGYGSSGIQHQSMGTINLNTGAIQGNTAIFSTEPRSLAYGPGGDMFVLTVSGGGANPNRVYRVTPAFTSPYNVASGYTMLYNGPIFANGSNTTAGTNGIAASRTFVCTTNGDSLIKRNINNGAFMAGIKIPNGIAEANSGIIIDDCSNIYVGSSNSIIKYDSSLNQLSVTATTGAVYDLSEGPSGELLAAGNGFIGSYNVNYQQAFLTHTVSATPAQCGCTGTASVTANGGCSPYSYSWNTGNTNAAITNLCAGVYTVTVSSWCKNRIDTITIAGGGSVINVNTTQNICSGQTINIHGVTQSLPGIYTQTFTTSSGCDSVSAVTLVVSSQSTNTISVAACNSYTHNGQNYTSSGIYTQTLAGAQNCDSILTINLTMNPASVHTQTLSSCDSILHNSTWFYNSQNVNDTIPNGAQSGCDSITITSLVITSSFGTTVNQTACKSYTSPLSTYTLTGTYIENYTATGGCDSIVTLNLTINSATTNTVNVSACDSFQFNNSWITTSQTLIDTLASTLGCDSILTLQLLVNSSVFYSDTLRVCEGDSVLIHGSYTSTPGIYSQNYPTGNGCDSTAHIVFINLPGPVASFTATPNPTTIISANINFSNSSSPANSSWSWSFGDLLNASSTEKNPSYTYQDTGVYTVQLIVTNENGCNDTAYGVVRINADYTLFAPNSFTPNGDNINDGFKPIGYGIDEKDYLLLIFDRWGNEIFKTSDVNKSWDGKANGGKDIAQVDTYVWVVQLKNVLGSKHNYVGHVNLIR